MANIVASSSAYNTFLMLFTILNLIWHGAFGIAGSVSHSFHVLGILVQKNDDRAHQDQEKSDAHHGCDQNRIVVLVFGHVIASQLCVEHNLPVFDVRLDLDLCGVVRVYSVGGHGLHRARLLFKIHAHF